MSDDIDRTGEVVDLDAVRSGTTCQRNWTDWYEDDRLFEIVDRIHERGDCEYLLKIADEIGDADFGALMRLKLYSNMCISTVVRAGNAYAAIAWIESRMPDPVVAFPTRASRPVVESTDETPGPA